MSVDHLATHTGRAFPLFNPRVEDVCAEDIAHALALTNRFGGHTPVPYSVAEHSFRVCKLLRLRGYDRLTQLFGLLHDAAEAYVGDVSSPMKAVLGSYREMEHSVVEAVYLHFGLKPLTPQAVRQADLDMLKYEARWFWGEQKAEELFGHLGAVPEDLHKTGWSVPFTWREAEDIFLWELRKLTK